MINMMGIQGTKSNIACQKGGAASKGLEGIEFSDLLRSLDEAGKWQNQWKDDLNVDGSSGEELLSSINDLLPNTMPDNFPDLLFNNLAALVDAEFGSSTSSEKQLLTAEQLTVALEELAGVLDGVQNGGFSDGNEAGERLLSLLEAADQPITVQEDALKALLSLLGSEKTETSKVTGMQAVSQGGSATGAAAGTAAGTQQIEQLPVTPEPGKLSAAEPHSSSKTAAQGNELIDVSKSVVTGEAMSKEADTALIIEGLAKQVKGKTGEGTDTVTISERSAASEVPASKRAAPTAAEFLKLFAEQESQKGVQAQGELPQQENKSEVKSPTSFLINEGLNEGLNSRSAPIQTGSAQQSFAVSRAAPVMESAVLEQVIQAIESSSLTTDKNMHMLSISLKPEYLGELKLVITVEHGIVNAHFLAQNQMTANLIDSQLPDLKQSLSQQGVSWQDVTVSVDTGSTSTHSEQGAEQGMDQQWVGNGGFTAGEEDFLEPYSNKGWGMINYVV
jgi:flagellar hook-length control protein FliK